MNRKLRSAVFVAAVYLAFFASGAASLVAEVTWKRMLVVVVGNSISAAALIVAVFMGGLGLGSYLGGKIFGKRRASLRPYLLLELTIGVYVLLSPALFELLSTAFTALAESVDNRIGLTVVRVSVSMAALFIPATLMGATFPAMISGAVANMPSRRAARTGYLYSINTLGAALGCFAAGYHLLFEFSVQFTLACSLGLYLLAVVSALTANSVADWSPEAETSAEPTAVAHGDTGLWRFLNLATFGIGFVALAYEVLLTRLGILFLGNTVSVFALVLTGFLLGTGIAALAGTRLYDLMRSFGGSGDKLFGAIALAAGALVFTVPYLLLSGSFASPDHLVRFSDTPPINPLQVVGVIVVPTVLLGALLPIAIRMLQPDARGEATYGAATLYAVNTAGGLLGAATINNFVVPAVGMQGAMVLLTAICACIGAVGLLAPQGRPARWALVGGAVAALATLLVAVPPHIIDLYSHGVAASTQAESAEVLLVREGRAATVTVVDQKDPELGDYRDMYLNGVEEASTRYWHTQLFKLLGILPVLLHPGEQPEQALVIAFGAGITAGSVLASDQVSSLDVVDLNPDIEGINDLFTDVNGDVFHKPRFHFHNDDGRNYLVTSNKRYDLIIGDSTHPRAYDSWILYTKEFYEAVKNRLAPGGIFAQWVPVLDSMRGDLFRIHLNTFRSVFPNSTFWYVYGSDQAFLIATPEPLSIDAADLQSKLDRLPDWFRAHYYQIDTVARVAGFFWLDDAAMARMIDTETRVNTDNHHFFDKQSAVRPLPPEWQLPRFQASILPYLRGADDKLRAEAPAEQSLARLLGYYGFYRDPEALTEAFCMAPDNGNVQFWMSLAHAGKIPEQAAFCRGEEIKSYRKLLAQHADNYWALNGLAYLLAEGGDLQESFALARKAVSLAPQNGMVLDTYGWILFKRGDSAIAADVLEKAAMALPGEPEVFYHLGAAHAAAGNRELAERNLEKALGMGGNLTEADADAARALLEKLR